MPIFRDILHIFMCNMCETVAGTIENFINAKGKSFVHFLRFWLHTEMCSPGKYFLQSPPQQKLKIIFISDSYKKKFHKTPLGLCLAISMIHETYGCIAIFINQDKTRRKIMKKLLVSVFVIGALVAGYAMPVLACGGGGPY